jgi:hypothetical protein
MDAQNSTISSAGSAREPHQHFAARTQGAEGCAHVHGGQRDKNPGQRKQTYQGNRVGRGRQWQISGKGRHDRASQQHAAKDHIGRHAEQLRRMLGHQGFLLEQLVQHAR